MFFLILVVYPDIWMQAISENHIGRLVDDVERFVSGPP